MLALRTKRTTTQIKTAPQLRGGIQTVNNDIQKTPKDKTENKTTEQYHNNTCLQLHRNLPYQPH